MLLLDLMLIEWYGTGYYKSRTFPIIHNLHSTYMLQPVRRRRRMEKRKTLFNLTLYTVLPFFPPSKYQITLYKCVACLHSFRMRYYIIPA